jgi:S1-C subfamily serine protease
MRNVFYAFLMAGFATALLGLSLQGLTRNVDSLRHRVDDTDRSLRDARAEVDQLRGETTCQLESRVSRTEFEDLRHHLDTRDIRALYREILAPSVQVSAKGGVGGGTLIFSRSGHSYVITAYHVIQKTPPEGSESSAPEPPEVRIFDEKGELADEVEAHLTAHDERKDLALLRLNTDRTYPRVARMASRPTLRGLRVFTPLYAIGCPLGHDPLPTLGEIAALHKQVAGENFWMMNAPTIFGNSGGGVFHRETREMIGVSVMICTYDGAVSTPVPHLGILESLETVYDWLDTLHYQFIYDPAYTIEACEAARAEADELLPTDGNR